MVGRMISHYKILELISRNLGEVYLAEDTRFGKKVVLKIFGGTSDQSRTREMFEREAMVAAASSHPNIPAVFGVDEWEGRPFMVMEHMEGSSLEMRLLKGRLSFEGILEIGLQIADALEAIHTKGIIHRDIKPANIFLTADGQVKLCSFAHATTVSSEEAKKHKSPAEVQSRGEVVERYLYMSPEQLSGKPFDQRIDIFALGVVLYEMLTGSMPFREETAAKTVDAIFFKDPKPISKFRENVPRLLRKTIDEMLAKNPTERLSSANELRTRLEEVKNGLSDERRKRKYWSAAAIVALVAAVVIALLLVL